MTSCRLCMMLRVFLPLAAGLIIVIGFMPEIATPFGPLVPTPMTIAMIVPLVGIPGFIVKYVIWRKNR